jgi:hypothetical protein
MVNLIAKFLKVGYISFQGLVSSELLVDSTTISGCILSPLLLNFYFHELDIFISSLLFPLYKSSNLKKSNKRSKNNNALILEEVHKSNFSSYENSNLYYSRYLDNFILGFQGSKNQAITIMQYILHYICVYLKFSINNNKTSILHHMQGIMFLGYNIEGVSKYISVEKSFLKFRVPVQMLLQ